MRIFEWMAELRYRNSLLYRIGLIHFILFALLLIPLMTDSREVLGINTWIKPLKFCLSIGIYAWTWAWILFDIPGSRRWKQIISWSIAISMVIEIAVIVYQASRATESHFNFSTPFDSLLFAAMGIMILINTLAIIATIILYFVKKPNLDKAYLLALRLGLIVFFIGNWIGGVMIQRSQHAVGVEDGGPGLPFTNWSTEAGDLRIAHFLGLHSVQLIPLFSYFLIRRTSIGQGSRILLTIIFTLLYAGAVGFLYFQAMKGEPLFTMN